MANKKEKIKKEKMPVHNIMFKVKELSEDDMFLTKHLGEGSLGKTKFEASHTIPTMGLVVSVGKKRYLLSSQEAIERIISMHESLLK